MQVKKGFVLRFSPAGLRRLAEGTKRATVLRATQATRLRVGQEVIATVAGIRDEQVQLPLRIEQLHPLSNLGALPAAARQAGLELADFSTLPDWPSYQRAASRSTPGAAALLVLAAAGPVTGTIPDKPIRPRASSDSVQGRLWHRVTDSVAIHPADQVHEGDRAELRTRIAAAIRAGRPERDDVRMLALVTDALLASGRCGPAHLGKPRRRRLADRLEPALTWLTEHGVLAGTSSDRTWKRDLLMGLRINHEDRPPASGQHSG